MITVADILRNIEILRNLNRIQKNRRLWLKFRFLSLFSNMEYFRFRCNLCGQFSTSPLIEICARESASCYHCGSSLRYRSIIHILSLELFGESLILQDFPKAEIVGIGMSDPDVYAIPLSRRLSYTNTFYHKEPKVDITSIEPQMKSSCDFIISSEVFEHVPPPIELAFQNIYSLLKPGGVCVFTVPCTKDVSTKEHFPDLHDYKLVKKWGKTMLINKTKDGVDQIFDNLIFHGGKGSTLEMRVFSESSLIENISKASFKDIEIHKCHKPEYGIIWNITESLPISMRR